jgi:UDP:flavonoid glycosyltransferase YjiC (YdhE family)
MGADQPHNAARCDALGVGIALDPIDATPAHIRAAVLAVLDEPRYRAAAGQIRDEINALPDAAQAVRVLEATLRQRHKPKQ